MVNAIAFTPSAAAGLRIITRDATQMRDEAAVERAWTELRAQNPTLFDGPIMTAVDVRDLRAAPVVICERSSYKHVATRRLVSQAATSCASLTQLPDVCMLGVTGLIIGMDAGSRHVMIARRGPSVRMYPMLWEFAPAGGVPPASGAGEMPIDVLAAALADEADEELALDIRRLSATPVALCVDAAASSLDIVLQVDVPGVIDSRRAACLTGLERAGRDEYVDVAWLALSDIAAFFSASRAAISPKALAIARALGWL